MPTTVSKTVSRPAAPAAYRAVRLLELLAEQRGPVTVTAAAEALQLPKSSVVNLLTSLAETGMVRRHPRGWLLGYKVLELGHAMVASTAAIAEFRRFVVRSSTLDGETCLFAALEGRDVVYVDRHDGHQPVRFINEVGSRASAATTALGRALLATLDDDEVRARFAGVTLPRPTPRSLPDVDALVADLHRTRRRGYALDTGQGVTGVGCVAVAVSGESTPTAVSVSMLRQRIDRALERQLADELRELAERLSHAELD